jgi:hypothetical protein
MEEVSVDREWRLMRDCGVFDCGDVMDAPLNLIESGD